MMENTAASQKAMTGKGASLAQRSCCTNGLLRLSGGACVGSVFRSGSVRLGICFVRILEF